MSGDINAPTPSESNLLQDPNLTKTSSSDKKEVENWKLYECNGAQNLATDYSYKREIVWKNVIGFLIMHIAGIYGLYLMFKEAKWQTNVFAIVLIYFASEGVTIGAHRLYSHKSFKATQTLKVILLLFQTLAGQNCCYIWVRDHRQHHKYSDTDADPHNANRGFFFSHMGWLMSRKHPLVKEYGKKIDMSDLEADKLIMFQKKYYKTLYVIFALLFPVMIPVYYWKEDIWTSFYISYFFRYVVQLNGTWLVNSWAHLYGNRPFDKKLKPVETWFVGFISFGEGWHNYHHTFPWDYKAAELGAPFNLTRRVIEFCATLGLAYDLRTVSPEMYKKRQLRTGDGTYTFTDKSPLNLYLSRQGPFSFLYPNDKEFEKCDDNRHEFKIN